MMVSQHHLDALEAKLREDFEREIAGIINLLDELREELAKKDEE